MFDLVKKYIDNRLQLVKIEIVNIVANIAAGLVSSFLILVMGIFIIQMFSLALAFWLSKVFESEVIGFSAVGGIYVLFFIIYIAFSKKSIDTAVKDKVVQAAFAADDELGDNYNDYEEFEE